MLRGSVLACAALFCLPTIWQALVTQSITLETALIRFIIAVPVAAVLLALVRAAMRRQEQSSAESRSDRDAQLP